MFGFNGLANLGLSLLYFLLAVPFDRSQSLKPEKLYLVRRGVVVRPIDYLSFGCIFPVYLIVILKVCHLGSLVQRICDETRKIFIIAVDILVVCKAKRSLSHRQVAAIGLRASALIRLRCHNPFSNRLSKRIAQPFRDLLLGLCLRLPVASGLKCLSGGWHWWLRVVVFCVARLLAWLGLEVFTEV